MTEAIDEFTLLCESCGYPLTGLPSGGNCPECGRPISDSQLDQRAGSAWQQRPGIGSWLSTIFHSFWRPAGFFRRLTIEPHRSGQLFLANITAASLFIALGFTLSMFLEEWLSASMVLGLAGSVAWIVLALLTLIEYAGVQFFGRRSRWRVTSPVAWTVCAHASSGWALGGAVTFVAFIPFTWRWSGKFTELPPAFEILIATMPLAGLVIGLLIFETLVYIGIRQCRFANRMPPRSPPSMATDRDSHAGKGTEPGRGDPAS